MKKHSAACLKRNVIMGELNKKQYGLLNVLKIIAAFFVVCIHVHFPGGFGRGVVAVARFSVPFFFMVSGFFSYYEDKSVLNEKYKRKVSHIAFLFLSGTVLYFLFNLAVSVVNGEVKTYLTELFTVENFVDFLLFNHTEVSDFLWFLPALIYVYGVFFAFEKKGITKKLYFLIPVLFVAGVVLREIPEFVENTPDLMNKAYLCRNWLFVGLPFFMLGHFIKVKEDVLSAKLSDCVLAVIMLVATAEAVVVDLLHVQKNLYLGTFFAVFALFVFAVKNEGRVQVPRLAAAGAKYSFYVYLVHIIIRDIVPVAEKIVMSILVKCGVMTVAETITVAEKADAVLDVVLPFAVFAASVAVSAVYLGIKNTLKKKPNKQEK